MAVKSEWIRFGEHTGYFAYPEGAKSPLPGVVVIQEAWGVNDNIEDIARRLAAAGYAALAPDLFAVRGVRPEPLRRERVAEAVAFMNALPPQTRFDPAARDKALAALPPPERLRIDETWKSIFSSPSERSAMIVPLRAAFACLRTERPETKGARVGCVGFCMGGGLSALLACEEPEISAAAVFYGNSPPEDKIASIGCPVLAFYGGNDQRVNTGIPAFEEAMRRNGKTFERHVYEGVNHGFFNDTGPSYDVAAARDSFARLLTFFARNLAG
jgi:carboxymethylenebutenolidase